MTLPNFLYIGPPRAGSTWLYEVLRQHPQVVVPTLKDLYFFDRHFERGVLWYEKQFPVVREEQNAIGEISHDYLYSDLARRRIAKLIPDVRLLVILREPTQRAISHFRYLRRFGNIPEKFTDAVKEFPEILECGLYNKYLEPYLRSFPVENIKILLFDDLAQDPHMFAKEVFNFLSVHESLEFKTLGKVNATAISRSILISSLAKQAAHICRHMGWTKLLGNAKRSKLIRTTLYRELGSHDERFSYEDVSEFCDAFYSNDLESLQENITIKIPWALSN